MTDDARIKLLELLLKEVTQCLADTQSMLANYYKANSIEPDPYHDHRKLMIRTVCEALGIPLPVSELEGHEKLERQLENINQLLKNTAYEGKVSIDGDMLYFREDTDDLDTKTNWSNYCDIQDDLKQYGLALSDAQIEHDCISGELVYLKDQK